MEGRKEGRNSKEGMSTLLLLGGPLQRSHGGAWTHWPRQAGPEQDFFLLP